MLELNNSTPFVADFVLFPDMHGIETLYTLVKGTFDYTGARLALASQQQPLNKADEYLGEPANSSLLQASDYHLAKPATDIIVLGDAVAPDQTESTQLDVQIQVGYLQKQLRVFGDRDWQGNQISAPRPFSRMPMIYERAFGADGAAISQDEAAAADANPAGVGFLSDANNPDQTVPLPNIEDPGCLIQYRQDTPQPAGCSFIAPHWAQRRRFSGTYDEQWQRTRAPFLPKDFDPRFFNCASTGLVYDGFIQGGEQALITGLNEAGPWQFELPWIALQCSVDVAGSIYRPPLLAETIIIEPNKKQLQMVWRAALPVSKQALKIRGISLQLQRSQSAGVA